MDDEKTLADKLDAILIYGIINNTNEELAKEIDVILNSNDNTLIEIND